MKDDKRFLQMQQGVQDLERWLKDVFRQGLATLAPLPLDFWDDFAARMVDARLGGIARRIRLIKNIPHNEAWSNALLSELAELFLIVKAIQKIELLPVIQQQEILSIAGWNIKKETVLQQKPVVDYWLVCGQREGMEEKLRFRRTYLWGASSKRPAMILDYAWRNNPLPDLWAPGSIFKASMVYYPGGFPLRALLKDFQKYATSEVNFSGYNRFSHFLDDFSKALGASPWLNTFPALLSSIKIARQDELFLAVDSQNKKLNLNVNEESGWRLLAFGGGHPIALFAEWSEKQLSPLLAFSGKNIIQFSV